MADLIGFLNPLPPEDEDSQHALFVDRENELAQAVSYVQAARFRDPRRILAVVGQARVGKSHLLARAVTEIRRAGGFDAVVVVRVAAGDPDPRELLRLALDQVDTQLHNAWLEAGHGAPEAPSPLRPLDDLRTIYSEAIAGFAAQVRLDRAQTVVEGLKTTLSATSKLSGLLSLIGGGEISASVASERSTGRTDGQTRSVTVNRFEVDGLGGLLGLGHELVRAARPDWNTLLVIDDFDLLSRDEGGAYDPAPLLQQLFRLAQVDGLHVLTTVREDTFERHQKSFYRVAYAAAFPDDGYLREAYRRHVERFHDGVDPFGGAWVDEAARRSEGRIGMFMQRLHDVFQLVPRAELTTATLEGFLQRQWELVAPRERRAAEAITQAVRDTGGMVSEDAAPAVRRSALMKFVVEDYSSDNRLRVEPIFLSYMRQWTAGGE